MKRKAKFIIFCVLFLGIVFLLAGFTSWHKSDQSRIAQLPQSSQPLDNAAPLPKNNIIEPGKNSSNTPSKNYSAPLDGWQERITKKPFGIFITPENSPVSPEKFTGYHTGVDFEIFDNEEDQEVEIFAICEGLAEQVKFISGYGGALVQKCQIDDKNVRVLYGHLNLASISAEVGKTIAQGAKIGILGKSNSQDTDGERKHLHLGVYKGETINYAGYVSNKEQLINWLDPAELLAQY